MNKSRIDALERQVKKETGHKDFPAPGFFTRGPGVELEIEQWREGLLKQGFTLEAVKKTPAYIEGDLK